MRTLAEGRSSALSVGLNYPGSCPSTAASSSKGTKVRAPAQRFTLQRKQTQRRRLPSPRLRALISSPHTLHHVVDQNPQGQGLWALRGEFPLPSQTVCPWASGGPGRVRAGRTKHRRVVLGEDLILGPIREHVDEIAQVPQPVSQGPDGEVPRGEWLQVPQVAVSCGKDKLVPTTHRLRRRIRLWGFRAGVWRQPGFY